MSARVPAAKWPLTAGVALLGLLALAALPIGIVSFAGHRGAAHAARWIAIVVGALGVASLAIACQMVRAHRPGERPLHRERS